MYAIRSYYDMIPKVDDDDAMLDLLSIGVKSVYASVFYKASKDYMTATARITSYNVCYTKLLRFIFLALPIAFPVSSL